MIKINLMMPQIIWTKIRITSGVNRLLNKVGKDKEDKASDLSTQLLIGDKDKLPLFLMIMTNWNLLLSTKVSSEVELENLMMIKRELNFLPPPKNFRLEDQCQEKCLTKTSSTVTNLEEIQISGETVLNLSSLCHQNLLLLIFIVVEIQQ